MEPDSITARCPCDCGMCITVYYKDMFECMNTLWRSGWRPFSCDAWLCPHCVFLRTTNALQKPYPEEPLECELFVGWLTSANMIGCHNGTGVH